MYFHIRIFTLWPCGSKSALTSKGYKLLLICIFEQSNELQTFSCFMFVYTTKGSDQLIRVVRRQRRSQVGNHHLITAEVKVFQK